MKKALKSFKRLAFMMALVMLVLTGLPAALSADASIPRKEAGLQAYPVAASTTIYKGGMVCTNSSGYLVPAADTAGYRFVGIAYEQIDNSSGSDGDDDCRVFTEGVFKLTATSITQAMVGDLMYVTDDATIDESSTNDVCCGILVEYVSATSGWVDINRRDIPYTNGRLNLSSVNIQAAHTDGGLIKAGTSSARVTEDTADMKFMAFYFDNGAASGDNRGVYLRLYLTGGGGGEAARIFTTVEDVESGTAHGAHISLNFGDTGSLTGLGVAMRATLHIANQAWGSSGGTLAAIQAEIWSDGSASDPAGMTALSCIRVVNGGDATGMEDVDDDAFLFDFAGWTKGAGHMIQTDTGNVDTLLKCRDVDGTDLYIMCTKTLT